MQEKLDVYFAVFNSHINDAHARAVAKLEADSPEWAAEIREWHSRGIMGIFQQDPTPATEAYARLVMEYVNENRG